MDPSTSKGIKFGKGRSGMVRTIKSSQQKIKKPHDFNLNIDIQKFLTKETPRGFQFTKHPTLKVLTIDRYTSKEGKTY